MRKQGLDLLACAALGFVVNACEETLLVVGPAPFEGSDQQCLLVAEMMVQCASRNACPLGHMLECRPPPPLLLEGHQRRLQQRDAGSGRVLGRPSHTYMLTRIYRVVRLASSPEHGRRDFARGVGENL